jgi:hypothetical protein
MDLQNKNQRSVPRIVNLPSSRGLLLPLAALLVLALLAGGCASAKVTRTKGAGPLPKPDVIIVRDFAVTPDEVTLDKGVMATAKRESRGAAVSEEEARVGHMVAEKLSTTLVAELNAAGIRAVRANDSVGISNTTAILQGEFLTINQGDQTKRVWVGFGLGGSQVRTRIQVVQGGTVVAEGETATKSSLKPGMLTSLGASAAAGTATSAVVGATSQGVSEAFLANVEADAKRTAKEVAKKVIKAYKDRGWLQ